LGEFVVNCGNNGKTIATLIGFYWSQLINLSCIVVFLATNDNFEGKLFHLRLRALLHTKCH